MVGRQGGGISATGGFLASGFDITGSDLTLVCASAFRPDKFSEFVESVRDADLDFHELICVVPASCIDEYRAIKANFSIRLLASPVSNQVVQRLIGISHVKTDYIFQFDDDVILDRSFGKHLRDILPTMQARAIIGCRLLGPDGFILCERWRRAYQRNWLLRLYTRIINFPDKVRDHSIFRSGRIVPQISSGVKGIIDPAWASSALLYSRDATHEAEYMIRSGKSYYEDVYFISSLVKKRGYTLTIDNRLIIRHPVVPPTTLLLFLNTLPAQFRLVRFLQLSRFRFCIDSLVGIVYLIFVRIIRF